MPWWFALGVCALIALGIAGRVVIWRSAFGIPEADEALGGLMARHLLHGNLSIFFWDQGYGGPWETVLAAPLLAIFGDSWIALRIVPVLLGGVTALVVWRVGLRTTNRYAAITAAAVYFSFPSFLLWKSIHFHVFYASGMLLDALLLLLVLRLKERLSKRDVILVGFVAGVGLWQSFQLATVVPVAIGWLIWRRRDVLRLFPYVVPGLLAGIIPVLVSNLQHSWWSLHLGEIGIQSTYLSRLRNFYTNALPMSLDLRAPCTRHWYLFPGGAFAIYAALIVGFLALAWKARHTNRELLIVVVAVFPFIYAINQLTGTLANPGYALLLTPVLAILLCASVTRPAQGLWAMGAVVLVAGGTFVDLQANTTPGQPTWGCIGKSAFVPRDFGPLVHELDQLGIKRLYADYWVGYRINFETGERIIAAEGRSNALSVSDAGGVIPKPDDPSLRPRRRQYQEIVGRMPRVAWVIDTGYEEATLDAWAFTQAGYMSKQVGVFTIYWHGADSAGVGPP